jgi:rhodanese-related sulfurtransferase
VAQILLDHGWKNVHPLYGGFEAWEQAGGRTEPKANRA